MKLTVHLFARAKALAGRDAVTVTLPRARPSPTCAAPLAEQHAPGRPAGRGRLAIDNDLRRNLSVPLMPRSPRCCPCRAGLDDRSGKS